MKKKKNVSNFKQKILAVGIAIIFSLFIGYGINTFYPSPEYSDFCDPFERPLKLDPSTEDTAAQELNIQKQEECRNAYDAVREPYERNVFFATLILGTIAIILGGVVLSLDSVSSGLMGGGVLTVIYGTLRYWGQLSDIFRFLILGLVLALLIWIGYKKFQK